jgi:adenylate cyclase
MSRLTIRARLVILSGVLLCMLIATNLYLMRTLAKNSAAVATETELSSIIESANGARIAFGEMRYWLTDLAVSLLTPSESSAAAARGRMNGYLDRLALRKPSWWRRFAASATNSRSPRTMLSINTPMTSV